MGKPSRLRALPKGEEPTREMYEQACAEVAECVDFLSTEMTWENFRVEQMYRDDERKRSASEENARKLKNYLVESGHGIALLRELHELRRESSGVESGSDTPAFPPRNQQE